MERDTHQLDCFLHSLAAAVAVGVSAYLSEDSTGDVFPFVAAVVAFSMSFAFFQLLPRIRLVSGSLPQMSSPTLRQLLVFAGIVALALGLSVTDSSWRTEAPVLYQWIEMIGFILIIVSILGQHFYTRRYASYTAGLFGCLGAAGVGAQSGELVLTLAALVWGVAIVTAASARPSSSNKIVRIEVHPAYHWWYEGRPVLRTWVIAGLMLSSIPLADGAEHLQAAGYLPIFLRLP
jgi:uncharacterized membrane protein